MEGPGITRFAVSFLTVLLVILAPLFLCAVPPLHDYPFHLARADILASLNDSAFLRAHYEQGSFLLPNVGMDVVMIPLTRTLPILLAGRVFLGIVLIVLLTGTIALHASLHRRLSVWPLLAGFFVYNWIFLYGFLNYLLGVGLMLWAAAGWVALRDRAIAWRLGWATIMALILLACHLVTVGLFGIVVAGFELQRSLRMTRARPSAALRDLALAGLPFAIAMVVFVGLSPTAAEVKEVIEYHGGLGWKPLVAYRTLLTTAGWPDLLMLSPVAAGVLWALWRGHLHFATPMAASVLLLVAAFVVMPFYLFGSQFGDARLPIAILLVLIASMNVTVAGGRARCVLALGAMLLLCAHSIAIARDWRASDAIIAAITDAFRLLPDGTTLYAATAGSYPSLDYRDAEGLALWHPPLKHVVSLASLGRDIFVPSTWSDPYKQPMRVAPAFVPVKDLQGDNPFKTATTADLNRAIARIHQLRALAAQGTPPDCLLLLYPDWFRGELPPDVTVIARGVDFALLQLP
jgi:hypothetical protein